MKIGICGTHGTGKTTLAKRLAVMYNQPLISECIRSLSAVPPKDLSIQELLVLQQKAVNRQLNLEERHKHFVSDRTLFDYASYFFLLPHKNAYLEFVDIMQILWVNPRRYDLILYLPIEFELEDDGYRHTDKAFQKDVDDVIFEILTRFCEQNNQSFYTLTGSVEDRVFQFNFLVS